MSGTSDKLKGAVSKVKGEFKDQVGNATNDRDMQAEGKAHKAKGTLQDTVGDLKNTFTDK
ncbi:CsbD family protein [Peribacillus deserti]|uniref:CsbD family protein n=2 Tax=Peribacillus deserti TaxID=673318 RepID=A0A2N5MAL4_9BACI|nr:CsbD family protein [Peribacillus deserti]PLT31401.1 CsbD family protein [Peribacillus deserti]